jgi:hypothetical protein
MISNNHTSKEKIMSKKQQFIHKFSFNRVVDVAVARPRAYDAESFFGLVSLSIISGILMAPSLLALLSLTGLL